MNIKNQVCSLGQAKKLRALGLIQDSAFYYSDDNDSPLIPNPEISLLYLMHRDYNIQKPDCNYYSAYTVSELGLFLPQKIAFNKSQTAVIRYYNINGYSIHYVRSSSGGVLFTIDSNNEANLRARTIIKLLLDGYALVEDLNKLFIDYGNAGV